MNDIAYIFFAWIHSVSAGIWLGGSLLYLIKSIKYRDKNINALVISTRHNTHAEYVTEALKLNKHVFVEKPGVKDAQQWATLLNNNNDTRIMMVKNNQYSCLLYTSPSPRDS